MTHVMRLLVVSALAAGTGWVLAQDDSLDALLMDLGGVEEVTPKQNDADKVVAQPEAEADDADATPEEIKQAEDQVQADADEAEANLDDLLDGMKADADEIKADADEVKADADEAKDDLDDLLDGMKADEDAAPEVAPAVEPEVEPVIEPEAEPAIDPEDVPAVEPDETPLLNDLAATIPGAKLTAAERQLAAELEGLEGLRQETLNRHGLDSLQLADAAYAKKEFDEALKKYDEANRYIRNRDDMIPERERARIGIRNAYFGKGKALLAKGEDLEGAKEAAIKAKNSGHANADRLIADIDKAILTKSRTRRAANLNVMDSEGFTKERLAIQDRLSRAASYFAVMKLNEAREQVELVLREDPFNVDAINLRGRIVARQQVINESIRATSHDAGINAVTENWTPPSSFAPDSTELSGTVEVGNTTGKATGNTGDTQEEVIKKKLTSITIPEVKFQPPATIVDAVDYFSQVSVNFDNPELPYDQRGVNIVLKLSGGNSAAAAPANDDPFAMAGSSSSGSSSGAPEIPSIRMRNATLKEALDMVCEVTGMKYNIRGNAIMIIPKNQSIDELETRTYNVMSTIIDRSASIASDASQFSGGGNSFAPMPAADSGDAGAQLKALFTQMGVMWPDGASIAYLSSIGKLRVKNTSENLAALESALDELNVTPYQVEVECRFVEVSQQDLNSLGFEWTLNQNLTGTIGNGINWSHLQDSKTAGGGLFTHLDGSSGTKGNNIGIQGGANAVNQGMRFLGDGNTLQNRVNLTDASIPTDDRFAMISGVFGELDISVILHMLSQRSDTDLLSSPKVVARPGQEAVMKVVTEFIYPTSFEVKELDINSGSNSSNAQLNIPVPFAVEPQNFEMREVGVILQVVPEVSTEGQMINLVVNPQVVELREWHNYGMKIPYTPPATTTIVGDALGTALDALTQAAQLSGDQEQEYVNLDMPQPFFHVRSVSTYLSVYNGATVVMGGMINEVRKSFEDKIPVLGDLPFVGFLFRSKAEYSDKRNLLIFLTARLVDPSGKTVRTAQEASKSTMASAPSR